MQSITDPAGAVRAISSSPRSALRPVNAATMLSVTEDSTDEDKFDVPSLIYFQEWGACRLPTFWSSSTIGEYMSTAIGPRFPWRRPDNEPGEHPPEELEVLTEDYPYGSPAPSGVPSALRASRAQSNQSGSYYKSRKSLTPCREEKIECEKPSHCVGYGNVTLNSFRSKDSGAIMQALEGAIVEAKADAEACARNKNCPGAEKGESDKKKGAKGGARKAVGDEASCPRKVPGSFTWIMAFVKVVGKSGRTYSGNAVALAQFAFLCTATREGTPTRNPDDPLPPESGGGTPTPPESGGGTPTPRGGGVLARDRSEHHQHE